MLHFKLTSFPAALLLFLISVALWCFFWQLQGLKPNVLLVLVVVLAFFVPVPVMYALFLVLVVAWVRYSPFLEIEYGALALAGVVSFVIIRLIFFRRTVPVLLICILAGQTLFWITVLGVSAAASIPFVVEFLYNSVVGIALFSLGIWLEKKFS